MYSSPAPLEFYPITDLAKFTEKVTGSIEVELRNFYLYFEPILSGLRIPTRHARMGVIPYSVFYSQRHTLRLLPPNYKMSASFGIYPSLTMTSSLKEAIDHVLATDHIAF